MRHRYPRIALGLAAIAAAWLGVASAQPPAPPLDHARVEAFVDGAVTQAMRTDHIAGVSVAVVDRSGVVMAKGYGMAALSPRRAVDVDTLFRVASISKTVVWISLMQLVEQGKIGLDDPINDHLPPALRVPDEGYRQPIRVRHLMTHSAGFEDSILEGFFLHDPARLTPLNDFIAAHRVHRVRPPGVVAAYSNHGAALAGALVAQVSGQPWQDYAEQHVLRPLGMATATYRQPYSQALARAHGLPAPMPAAIAAKVSTGFEYRAGAFQPQPFGFIAAPPPGALAASANDMALYMRALLDPAVMAKSGVLRADTALAMRGSLLTNTPELGGWRHGFMDFTTVSGRPAFGHDGDLIFEHSAMEIFPAEGLGIFVSVNTPTGVPLRETLPGLIVGAIAGPPAANPPRVADAKAQAAAVAGTYSGLRRPYFRTERGVMRLFAATPVTALAGGDILLGAGPEAERYYPIGGGVFARADGPGRIAFHAVAGRLRLYDPFSAGPADRVGFFESGRWLMLLAAGAVVVGVWGVASGLRRLVVGDTAGRAASLALDGLCLVWLAALGLFVAGLAPWAADQSSVVFTYPGKVFPLACWALLIAAIATPLATLLAVGPLRPKAWSAWRWIRQGAALAVFLTLAVTLWTWGFLGFSGW